MSAEIVGALDGSAPRTILFLDNVGVAVSQQRLELFSRSFRAAPLKRLVDLAKNAVKVLAHTPIGGIGVNFEFREEEVAPSLHDKLVVADHLEARFKIEEQMVTTRLAFGDGIKLNLKRRTSDAGFLADFNFHHDVGPTRQAGTVLDGMRADDYLSAAMAVLKDVYGLERYDEVCF